MSSVMLACGFALLAGAALAAARIEDAAAAEAYVDALFGENGCEMTFGQIDAAMRADGIIPTEGEMASDIGVVKFIRQRRVMAALERLFRSGALAMAPGSNDAAISRFGGCA